MSINKLTILDDINILQILQMIRFENKLINRNMQYFFIDPAGDRFKEGETHYKWIQGFSGHVFTILNLEKVRHNITLQAPYSEINKELHKKPVNLSNNIDIIHAAGPDGHKVNNVERQK